MKMNNRIFAAGVVLAMLLSLGACSVTVDKPDEGVIPTEVIEATAVPDPEAEPLTEEELLPYLEFHDLFVRQMDEPIEVFEDTGGNEAEEPTEGGDAGEADTDSGGEEAPEAEIEDTGGEETAAEDETAVLDENKDPMGYIASITKYYEETVQNEVIRNISYDSTGVDVTVTGEYEITYTVTVDRDAYDAALLAESEGKTETEDVALEATEDKDEYYVEDPSTEDLDLENGEKVTIVKTVFVVDEDVFNEMAATEGSVIVNDWLLYTTVDVESENESESDTEVKSKSDTEVKDEADVSNNSKSDSAASVNGNIETKNEDTSNKVFGSNNSTSDSNGGSTSNSGGNGSGGSGGTNSTTKPTTTAKPTATPAPTAHVHNWTTKTEKVAEVGHWESVQVGTRSVDNGYWKTGTTGYRCNGCGKTFTIAEQEAGMVTDHCGDEMTSYSSIKGDVWVPDWTEQPVYEDRWVIDTPASTHTYEICSFCGAAR